MFVARFTCYHVQERELMGDANLSSQVRLWGSRPYQLEPAGRPGGSNLYDDLAWYGGTAATADATANGPVQANAQASEQGGWWIDPPCVDGG